MNQVVSNSQATYAFLSIRQFEKVGYCGGLLIVSHLGRPLEFHCSAPIEPNRAQQILYGKTYESYLYCEQIGMALIEKARCSPSLLITDSIPLLTLSSMITTPVVLLENESSFGDQPGHGLSRIRFGNQHFWTPMRLSGESEQVQPQEETIRNLLENFTKSLTFEEPFERIEKAMEEAQVGCRTAA